jgi:hypothetical protein
MTLQVTTPDDKTVQFLDETLPSNGNVQTSGKIHKFLQQVTSGAIIFIHHLQQTLPEQTPHKPEIQQLLDTFSHIFSEPIELPPQRDCDHSISLFLCEGGQPKALQNTSPSKECSGGDHQDLLKNVLSGIVLAPTPHK